MGDDHVSRRCRKRKGFHYSGTHGASDKRGERKREKDEAEESRYRLVTGNSSVGCSGSERQDRQVWFTSGSLRPAGQLLFFFFFFSSVFFLIFFLPPLPRRRCHRRLHRRHHRLVHNFLPLFFFATLLTPVLILTPKGRCNKVHSRK